MAKKKGTKRNSSAGKNTKISYSSRLMLVLNFIAIVFLLLSFTSRFVSPESFWALAFMGLLFPVFALINLFFVLFWLVFLKTFFLFSLIALVICWNQVGKILNFGSRQIDTPGEKTYKVLSYNVRLFDLYNWKNTKAKITRKGIFDLIYEESPDILCLQEYYTGDRVHTNFEDTLHIFHNYEYGYIGLIRSKGKDTPFGLATFSKYPIIAQTKELLTKDGFELCLVTDVKFPKDTVRVLNAHLESVRFVKEDYNFVGDIISNEEKTPLQVKKRATLKIFGKMKNAYIKRVSQVEILSKLIDESPYPVILAADFNDTPVSYAYHQIDNRLNDSFEKSGFGIGQTYSGSIGWLRIDYIFTSENIKVNRFTTLNKNYSDHYPLESSFTLPSKQ